MHSRLNNAAFHPGISMHHIPVGNGVAGFLFVFATIFIFGVGFPPFLELLAITGMLGILASGVIVYRPRRHALRIQALDLHNQKRQRIGESREDR